MKISRLSTFTLAIVLFTMGALILPANTALAEHCKGKHKNDPGCDDPGGDPSAITYTAELRGAFVFDPLPVTLEGQDERLRASVDAVMLRADSTEQATWDNVFSMPDPEPCDLFGPPGAVDSFTAFKKAKGVKGWRISRPGGVYVQFAGELPTADGSAAGGALVHVSLQLRGNCQYSGGTDPCDPFLPDPDVDYSVDQTRGKGISEIPLQVFSIHAKALKGDPQFEGCHTAEANLLVPSILVITATAP